MVKLKIGDRINVKIKANCITTAIDITNDDEKTFDIIACDDAGFFIKIPIYILIKDTRKVDYRNCKKLGIDERFVDEEFIHITEDQIVRISSVMDGCICSMCGTFSEYGAPNQPDEQTMICWSCSTYPPYL